MLAKNERGYRLNKKALLITTNLTSICCVYKEKLVKDVSYFIFLENVLTDFEKCECSAAFLDSCASRKRNNQIQNKIIKSIIKHKLYTNVAKDNR